MTNLVLSRLVELRSGIQARHLPWMLILAIPLAVAALDPANLTDILDIASGAFIGTLPFIAAAVLLIAGLKATGSASLAAPRLRRSRNPHDNACRPSGRPGTILFVRGHSLHCGSACGGGSAFSRHGILAVLTSHRPADRSHHRRGPRMGVRGRQGGCSRRPWTFRRIRCPSVHSARAFAAPVRSSAATGCCGCDDEFTSGNVRWQFWREASRRDLFRSEAISNGLFLVKWLALAYAIEALLITYVPAELIAGVVGGDGFLPIVIGALVGAPAYLNSYAAPALVAGLMEQGMSAGAGMAFMVAGAVSSIPAMVAVWSWCTGRSLPPISVSASSVPVLIGAVFGAIAG